MHTFVEPHAGPTGSFLKACVCSVLRTDQRAAQLRQLRGVLSALPALRTYRQENETDSLSPTTCFCCNFSSSFVFFFLSPLRVDVCFIVSSCLCEKAGQLFFLEPPPPRKKQNKLE